MDKILSIVGLFIGFIVVITLLMTFPVLWLWNWLMPVVFRLPEITFWQALGISLLSSLLFKSYNFSSKN